MDSFVTLAVFNNAFDIKYNLLKSLLDEAHIPYFSSNENLRSIKPMPFTTPSNVSIELKVYRENEKEAHQLLDSIT